MTTVVVSVLVHDRQYLATLARQDYVAAELITWRDDDWHEDAALVAQGRGWSYRRAGVASEALDIALGSYLIEWNVYEASDDVLASLIAAADEHCDKRGSVAANFDPVVLWRRDEFLGATGRSGLAQASGTALDAGSSTVLIPR